MKNIMVLIVLASILPASAIAETAYRGGSTAFVSTVYYPQVTDRGESPRKLQAILDKAPMPFRRVNQLVRPDGIVVSNVCSTPIGWCYMVGYWPIGSNCWCPNPAGPVPGYVGG